MSFNIIRNDITRVNADAIVNTANPEPICGAGTDYAIYRAAGMEQLLKARKKIGRIERGEARETKAFNLSAKYIIHTVGPVWTDGTNDEFTTLHNCYLNSLLLAKKLKCKSIAFPLISTGVYGFPKDKALEIAAGVINDFIGENDINVSLVVFDAEAFDLSSGFVSEVKAYVDENYVSQAYQAETLRISDTFRLPADRRGNSRRKESKLNMMSSEEVLYSEPMCTESIYETNEKTFQEKLLELIDERELSSSEVYTPVEISRQSFSKILCNKDYHPTKGTAILFCLSLKLNLEQTLDLLARAGFTLSPCNKPDLVIKDCILKKQYNRVLIDITMDTIAHTTIKNMK